MRIVIERSGGFTGIKRRYEREIDEAQLEALKNSVADDANYPDGFNYRVIVEGEQGNSAFHVSEEVLQKILGDFS
jgi:hypothetical protein